MKPKIIPIIIIVISISIASFGQTDKDYNKVRGKVKSLNITWYKAIDSNGIIKRGDRNGREFDLFDERSNIIETDNYYAPPALSNRQVFRFDKNNNIREIKSYNASGISNGKQVLIYNEQGKEIEAKYYYPDSTTVNDSAITKYIDDIGVMNEYKWAEYYKTFKINRIDSFKLDKNGKCIEISHYSNSGLDSRFSNIYDDNGNLIECVNGPVRMGGEVIKDVYKYDKKGNVLSITETSSSGERASNYKYEFDSNGNWVKRIEFDDGKATWIIERAIVYR